MSDLEDELRQLQPGTPPAHWRADILAKCEGSIPPTRETHGPSWRDWLWPSPAAWGALAAIWLALAVFHQANSPAGSRPHNFNPSESEFGLLVARHQYQAVLASLR